MSGFFQDKRWVRITVQILLSPIILLLPILTSLWLFVGIGNPTNSISHALLGNQLFRDTAGSTLVENVSKSAKGEERKLFDKKGPQISATLSTLLGTAEFRNEVDKISEIVYKFYTVESSNPTSINPKPIAEIVLTELVKVDSQFSKLKKEVGKIKLIALKPLTNSPSISQILGYLNLAFYTLWIFAIGFNLIFFRYARSKKLALRYLSEELLAFSVISIAIYFAATSIISSLAAKNSEPLARIAIPIASGTLISKLLLLGILALVIAIAILLIPRFLDKKNQNKSVN